MAIKIFTDSVSDLPEALARDCGITVIPCYVNAGGRSYLDGIELSHQEFYQNLPGYTTPPTTSSPGIGAFIRTYEEAIKQGASGIISLHVASNFSNVFNVAQLAAREITSIPVSIIDTGQLTLAQGLQAVTAAEAASKGWAQEAIVSLIQNMIKRTYIFAVLDTLEFLRRSGRASRLQASLGSWLDVKPVIKVHQGEVTMERTRTRRKATEYLLRQVEKLGALERVALIHSHAPIELFSTFTQQVCQNFHLNGNLISAEVTPTIGAHVGPAAVGVVVVAA